MKQSRGKYVLIKTFTSAIPQGGSEAERDQLAAEWINSTIANNNKIVNHRVLKHFIGGESTSWVLILEYKELADIEEAYAINNELANKRWTDAKAMADFDDRFLKYFPDYKHTEHLMIDSTI